MKLSFSPRQKYYPNYELTIFLYFCKHNMLWKSLSRVRLYSTPWTIQSMEFSRPVYWRGVAFPFSRGSSQPRDPTQPSRIVGRFFTSWATREAQEYWSGYPIPFPEDLPDPGIKPGSPALQADSLPTELSGKPIIWCFICMSIFFLDSKLLEDKDYVFLFSLYWKYLGSFV